MLKVRLLDEYGNDVVSKEIEEEVPPDVIRFKHRYFVFHINSVSADIKLYYEANSIYWITSG